ncbi:MAG: hypothetical protein M3R63_02810 [Actinomycetota bacterium]|nr:hypothetical protein [Actinomycetota bacterium]
MGRETGVLTGICRCACGAVTDHTGAWRHRNTRGHHDPAGLRCPRTPQSVRPRVVADTIAHPSARHHPRSHPDTST